MKKKEKNKNKRNNINKSKDETNQQETIINSSNCYEEDESKIIYLINFLQNILNDNKKTILYNFWKNLQKIKTNYILYDSLKSKGRFKSIKYNNQHAGNKNIIEILKFKPSKKLSLDKEEENNTMNNIGITKEELNNENKGNNNYILNNKSCINIFDKKKKMEKNLYNNTDMEQK